MNKLRILMGQREFFRKIIIKNSPLFSKKYLLQNKKSEIQYISVMFFWYGKRFSTLHGSGWSWQTTFNSAGHSFFPSRLPSNELLLKKQIKQLFYSWNLNGWKKKELSTSSQKNRKRVWTDLTVSLLTYKVLAFQKVLSCLPQSIPSKVRWTRVDVASPVSFKDRIQVEELIRRKTGVKF